MRIPVVTHPLLAALLLAIAPFASSPALAAASAPGKAPTAQSSPITWSVKPSPDSKGARTAFDYATDPGTQVDDTVLVINSGVVAADFSVYAADAINDRETGDLSLVPKATKSSDLGAWVTLNTSTVHLEPGTQASIPFTMLVPSDASPGDHSAGIVASSTTTGKSKGQTVLVEQRVGARINLRVSGALAPRVTASGFVSSFTPSFNPFAPGTIDVDYSVANRGNIRLDIGQKLDVVGPFGIHLGEVSPPTVRNLLPGQSAHIVSRMSGIGALLLAWSTVKLTPGPAGIVPPSTTAPSTTATDERIDPNADAKFEPVSATSLSIAITWTLMAIFVILALLVLLVARYIRTTRAQFYEAVDRATAEARENSAHDVERSETVPTR